MGDGLVWLVDKLGSLLGLVLSFESLLWLGGLAAAGTLWRLSVALGPRKLCKRCKGAGAVPGPIGGRKTCPRCKGRGNRPRLGASENS